MAKSDRLILTVLMCILIHVVVCTPRECVATGKTNLECITDELVSQISNSGLIASRDGKAYAKDSALAAIVFSQNSRIDLSKRVWSALLQIIETDGFIRAAYAPSSLTVLDSSIAQTSDLAFVAISLVRAHSATSDTRFLDGSARIMNYIQQNLQPSNGCYSPGATIDQRVNDQNVVIYAAARYLYSIKNELVFQTMMLAAKSCLDSTRIVTYPENDFMHSVNMRTNFWFAMATDEISATDLTKYSKQLGSDMVSNTNIDAEFTASAAIALLKNKMENTAFVKQSVESTLASTTSANAAWTALMLQYIDGSVSANPFIDKTAVDNDLQNRAIVPEVGANTAPRSMALVGIIIAAVSGAACCCVVAAIVGFFLLMRTMLAAQEKQVKPLKLKPNVQLIDMRAMSSPLSPVDGNSVYSPATPGDAFSPQPYSPLPHHYHIVPPTESVWSPTV